MSESGCRPVLVAIGRPEGYADVHQELVVCDALHPEDPWPHEIVRDDGREVVIALERLEGYEDEEGVVLAHEAIKPSWTTWRLVER